MKIQSFRDYCKQNKIDGILCIETFERKYIKHILSLNIPTVFIDAHVDSLDNNGNYDIVLMESSKSVTKALIKTINASGISHIGFVGDVNHCMSFKERFVGYQVALIESKIRYNPHYDILEPDEFPYGNINELSNIIKNKSYLPDCYVCANDFIAISMINSLNHLGYKVPEDIQVIGFDNTNEAKQFHIPLTTIDTNKNLLGKESIATLLNRIKYTENKNRLIYIKTTPIYRESTK
jgi:LacI family transcriptional regulator